MVGYGPADPVALGGERTVKPYIASRRGDGHLEAVAGKGDIFHDDRRGHPQRQRSAINVADEADRQKPEVRRSTDIHQEIPNTVEVRSLATRRSAFSIAAHRDWRSGLCGNRCRGSEGCGQGKRNQVLHIHSPCLACIVRNDRTSGTCHRSVSVPSTSWDFADSLRFFANVGSMQFTQRQRLSRGRWRPLLAPILVGMLLGFAGPFGSYPAFPTATRYGFWLGMTAAGAIAAVAVDAALPLQRPRAGAIRMGAIALVSALPMTFVAAWTMALVQPGRFFVPQQLPLLFACVAVVQFLIVYATTATAFTAHELKKTDPAPFSESDAQSISAAFPPALLTRLPPGIGRDIIALETEDHYLRVHTISGSTLILMRMVDAVALLDPQLGAQVHRRWWVAQTAVTGVRTEGQKLFLCLIDDRMVPVGRTFSAVVRARFGRRAADQ